MASTRFYENSTSGLNFDRFVDRFDESTLTKVRQQYWTAKQLIRSKLGKKEDEYLLASDAEFDAKISLFKALRDTSDQMLCCVDDYQHFLGELIQTEISLGRMLKEDGRAEESEAGKAMTAVGRVQTLSAHHRQQIRGPLVRFLNELQVFTERAILDCAETVEAAERARIEYRGSLLWMKKTSNELDPDTENAMERFRQAQSVVRKNKEKLDGLKLDTLQKVDLLAASRCNLFSQLLESYQKCLFKFYEQTSLAYTKIYDFVCEYKHYEFEILKELIGPSLKLAGKKEDDEHAKWSAKTDEKEDEMERILLGLETSFAADAKEERSESPLGQVSDSVQSELTKDEAPSIGPLPQTMQQATAVPKIAPPPGWKPSRNEKNYSNDLKDLLSLNDQPSEGSFLAEWSRLSAPPAPSNLTSGAPTSSSIKLPSQLLDLQDVSDRFPNPFKEPIFDIWSGFLSEFDGTSENATKSC